MCNDIPRNRLHEKMFGELIAEELDRTLSHIKCTPASVGGLKIRNDLLRNLGSKDSHDLGDFFSLCGFPERKNAGKYEYIGMYMRENGTICAFGFFSQVL